MKNTTTDELWLNFESMSLEKQVSLIAGLTGNDRTALLLKFFVRNRTNAVRVFKKLKFQQKIEYIKFLKNPSAAFVLMTQSERFRLVRENHSYSDLLSNQELIILVKERLTKISHWTLDEVLAIHSVADDFNGLREGWKGQDYVSARITNIDAWFVNFFARLSAERKFFIFQKIPFKDYMRILYLFKLFVAGMIDDHVDINQLSIAILLFMPLDYCDVIHHSLVDINEGKNRDLLLEHIGIYSLGFQKKCRLGNIATLIEFNYQAVEGFFLKEILRQLIEKMSDSDLKLLIKKCPAAKSNELLPFDRYFYLYKKNLNTDFNFLEQKIASGKEVPIRKISPTNQLRLLAAVG